ncbi:MAG: aldo/keto reductase [Planctomycetes bacterium]|jgi:aryl-alcohol dehydrogenase-like predicted oxidoreductase|nr:aldo/keto reductase [Planctomycetota bacterium]
MHYAPLGRTGLSVSRFCLGTMNFGPQASETDSFAIMDRALELGINFFDTADVYGGKKGQGVTEQIIGRWLASGGRRERIILATKVHGTMGEATFDRGLSAAHIRRACEDSLRRLQTDYIDLYQMHHIERSTPWDEIFQAMQTLVQQGKIIYVGGSNFAAWDIATANQIAARRNFLGLVSEQSKYSLACRHIELEVLPCCRHYGVGVIPWSPLDGGLLGGVLNPGKEGRRVGESMLKRSAALRPTLEKWEDFCRRLGEKPAAVALAWMLANPVVTSPIIGPRTMDQLVGAMRALDLKLDASALKTLDEIWPGPGGEAPQAYAW